MYQEIRFPNGGINPNGVKRNDGAFIPFDPANSDYQAYLKWLEDGNTPEAADAAPTQEG